MNQAKAAFGMPLKHALRVMLIRSITQYDTAFENLRQAFLTIPYDAERFLRASGG
jgi:hypothetical protein